MTLSDEARAACAPESAEAAMVVWEVTADAEGRHRGKGHPRAGHAYRVQSACAIFAAM